MITKPSLAAASSTLLVAGLLVVLPATQAQAVQGALPANTASAWQTNGTVRAIAYAKGVVYVGGDFTSVRPPGSAAGSGEVARTRLAAFSSTTGALITSFSHNVPASVQSLAVSPDGATLYVGGDFTTVDGVSRSRVASFTTSSGALTSWAPTPNGRVKAIAPTAANVYLGGSFSRIGTTTRNRVAAVSAVNGALNTTFTASVDNIVYAMALSKTRDKLYLAGGFLATNGDPTYHGAAAVSTVDGSTIAFPAVAAIPPLSPGCSTEMKDVKTDASSVYFASEGTGGGCFDGTFSAQDSDGALRWQSQCLGATQDIEVIGTVLYAGSHAHDCTTDQSFDPDAFPEVGWSRGISRHLTARSTVTGALAAWYPNTDGGPGGQGLGPRTSATDGTQLFLGGEFTTVNGQPQQGFARFSPATGDLTAPARPAGPVAVARAGGKVSVYVQAPVDIDDTDVVVRLYRDGGSTPIASAPAHSLFWRQPVAAFSDDALAVGSSHTYTADAVEANGSNASARSIASSSVVVSTTEATYPAAVNADDPTLLWRLSEASGPVAGDQSAAGHAGVYSGTTTRGATGATSDGNRATTTDGISGVISSAQSFPTPDAFSVEAWVKTTSTSGGKIIGFGNRQNGYDFSGNPGVSSNYDKHVYMTNDGRLVFGVYLNGTVTVSTAASFNDGQWHHVVGAQGAGGMALYVDGQKLGQNGQTASQGYQGYWRVGGDNINGWPDQPTSSFFAGQIDEVAVYPAALSRQQVVQHYVASGRQAPPSTLPTDAYGTSVNAAGPSTFWRLDDVGTTAADSSDNGSTGQYVGGVAAAGTSAVPFGHAATFDGATGNVAAVSGGPGPSTYSTELWFSTMTTAGGKLIGFGNSQTGSSGGYDKHVYLTDDGRLVFGVYNGSFDTVASPAGKNDGAWHHVVATQGGSGMRLYVDDVLVGSNGVTTNQGYDGFWRVGGDNLGAWPDRPSSDWFAGSIDEVAIYPGVLSATQVDDHYRASGRSGPDTVAPTTAVTSPATGATVAAGDVTVTATATDAGGVTSVSVLVDGAVVGTDTTAPYTAVWTAMPGSYTLASSATDAAGNIGTSQPVQVTVTAPDTVAPTVTIDTPAAGAQVYGPTSITATASDDQGVASVAFLVDGTLLSTDTTAPYAATWTATAVGQHSLTAVAQDGAGNTTTSSPVGVTVPADTTAPSAPGGLTATAVTQTSVALSWTASTDDRQVAGYRLVRDGVEQATLLTGTSATDSGLAPGSQHTYTVRAMDAAGNVGADSGTVTVTTTASQPVLFTDTWSGANGTPWGAPWTTSAASGSLSAADGGGQLAVQDVAGSYARAVAGGVAPVADSEVLTSFRWSSTTAVSYLQVYLRGSGGWQNAYRPRSGYGVELSSNATAITLRKNVAGISTTLATIAGGQTVSTAPQMLRLRVQGSSIQVRVWPVGQQEPVAWTASVTDSSVTGSGQLFVSHVRGGSNVGAKTITLDDLSLRDVGP